MTRKRWRGKHDATGLTKKEQYFGISYKMARSPAFRSLSGGALKVFIEIRTRFHGSNNGELSLSVKEGQKLLGLAHATIRRAFAELEAKGFLRLIRQGHWYGHKAALFVTTDRGHEGNPPTNPWRYWKASDGAPGGSIGDADGAPSGPQENISRAPGGSIGDADGAPGGPQNPRRSRQKHRQASYPQDDGAPSGSPIYHSSTAPLPSAANDTAVGPSGERAKPARARGSDGQAAAAAAAAISSASVTSAPPLPAASGNTTRPYSIAEAASYCELSIRTLHRAIDAGLLKSRLIRNRRRFLKADLDDYLSRGGVIVEEAHP